MGLQQLSCNPAHLTRQRLGPVLDVLCDQHTQTTNINEHGLGRISAMQMFVLKSWPGIVFLQLLVAS